MQLHKSTSKSTPNPSPAGRSMLPSPSSSSQTDRWSPPTTRTCSRLTLRQPSQVGQQDLAAASDPASAIRRQQQSVPLSQSLAAGSRAGRFRFSRTLRPRAGQSLSLKPHPCTPAKGHQKPLFACSGTMAATAHLLLLHCPCRPASVVCGRLLAAPALAAAAGALPA